MRLFLVSCLLFASLLAALLLWAQIAGAVVQPHCPSTMGEPCPRGYGIRLCPTLAYNLATDPNFVDVYDFDFIMHSAGCDQRPSGAWVKRTGADSPNLRCSRRAYWLIDHGYSILRAREQLFLRGCKQFEDGTYYDATHG